LTRYCEDGRIEIDNNAAERSLWPIALGRKNYLFAGSDAGGDRAAITYSCSAGQSSTASIWKHIFATCSSASPSTRSTALTTCYLGILLAAPAIRAEMLDGKTGRLRTSLSRMHLDI
jgi:hypothetical protein